MEYHDEISEEDLELKNKLERIMRVKFLVNEYEKKVKINKFGEVDEDYCCSLEKRTYFNNLKDAVDYCEKNVSIHQALKVAEQRRMKFYDIYIYDNENNDFIRSYSCNVTINIDNKKI